ncbi:hypothetical protein [Melittangium boletus]|uniref:hypothetical protein n=1 Tax=Melittangium boletus TaxID=83453 RepID=UPI003DA3DD66
MSRFPLWSCLVVLASGCAGAQGFTRSDAPGYPLGQPAGEALRVDGESITGPSSALFLSHDTLRGQFQGAPIDVSLTATEIGGSVGNRQARLTLEPGEDFHVWGYFGAVRVDYTLKPDRLEGQVGRCRYKLMRGALGFLGERSCGGPLEATFRVNFPAPLFKRSPGESASLLILALVNSTPTYSTIISPERRFAPPDRVQPRVPRDR